MTKPSDPTVIVGAARTPMGGLNGALAAVPAPELGARAIRAALDRGGVPADAVDEVVFGTVLAAGQRGAPARQACLGAGIPTAAGCTTVNKMCSSGMKAAMFADAALRAGLADVVVAGGMESMSNAPYLVLKGRTGYRLGHGDLKDHMFWDGLEDPHHGGKLMGAFAEDTARAYGFTREAQDEFAIRSLTRAQAAVRDGTFAAEVVPVPAASGRGETTVEHDEQPLTARAEKIPTLRPAFAEGGTVTAANSSSISDGAAALVLARRSVAEARGWAPRATLVAQAGFAQAPERFTTAPVGAIRRVLERAGWSAGDVDLWEINEAFAVVVLVAMRELGLPAEGVNVHGGACALGHPVGCSGARIVVTLLAALEKHGLRRGVAALCAAGGEATAVAVERVG